MNPNLCPKCGAFDPHGVVYRGCCKNCIATGPAPKEEEMEPDKYCDKHKCYYAPNEGCEKCTAKRRAVAREAYMAALGGLSSIDGLADDGIVQHAEQIALETVRRWDAFMAAVDTEGGE